MHQLAASVCACWMMLLLFSLDFANLEAAKKHR